ncbi:MAG TPA: response regulator [Bryobacteraceae bacterium]|nr:response regulator [Bryobacteraceae bacterium]
MSRILLVDDSPHAQRMGERILGDEGYEVVAVSNADSALIRLEDVDPDVVLADAVMPGRSGYEICQFLKMSPRHKRVRVILTAGAQEAFDDERAKLVQADGVLKKPFEASVLLAVVKSLAAEAERDRESAPAANSAPAAPAAPAAPFVAVVDAEQVRAAVTVALDASMESIVAEIANRVMAALQIKPAAEAEAALGQPRGAETPVLPPPAVVPLVEPGELPPVENARRVTPLRRHSTSILGLEGSSGPEIPDL